MKKTAHSLSLVLGLVLTGPLLAGCGESAPVNSVPAAGGNPYVSGTAQERIDRIQADGSLSPEEKARRIAVIKERNKL